MNAVEYKMVSFHGDELMAAKTADGRVHVGVKWVCVGIGLGDDQTRYQMRKVQEDAVLSKGVSKITLPTQGGEQTVTCLELTYLPLWLAKINANIIDDPVVQDKLIAYQLRAKDVLAEAFMPKAPTTIEDLIILQAQSIKQLKAEVASLREQTQTVAHRIDSLDTANIQGDLRQRLDKMLQRYAWASGTQYAKAWDLFDQAYNTAFRTNLTMLRENYSRKHGLSKTINRPEYLELTGHIEDAIRIADKLLASARTT